MTTQLKLPLGKISSPSTFSTFTENMKLPIHRWFRYSAGFSGQWVETIINQAKSEVRNIVVFDPFAGAGMTLIAAEKIGVESYGIEAHPFVAHIAQTKLLYQTDCNTYLEHIKKIIKSTETLQGCVNNYPTLIRQCFNDFSLECLDRLKSAWINLADRSPESELAWLTLITILRHVSHVGTAPWQYILPNKTKKSALEPMLAFQLMADTILTDMKNINRTEVKAKLIKSDARNCSGVSD